MLLIFLLASFKSISQTGTQSSPVVTLTETQARAVITDLIRYDVARQVIRLQEKRLEGFQEKEIDFTNRIKVRDSIIEAKQKFIDLQKQVVNTKKPLEFHGYLGVQTTKISLNNPYVYGKILAEFKRVNIGAQYFIQSNNLPGYNLIFEYKLF